jgi:diacylglycerol kinase family enzyme
VIQLGELSRRIVRCALGGNVAGYACTEVKLQLSVGHSGHGTGNDFHRNFENGDSFFDIEAQIKGESRPIDIFRCNDTYGINMINVGFDCDVAERTSELQKKYPLPRKMAYLTGLMQIFFRPIGVRFRLELANGEKFNKNMTLSLVANGCYCGGGFKSAPLASLTDGLLDVCVIDRVSRARFLSAVGAYKKGEHLDEKHHFDFISYRQTPSLRIKFSKPQKYCVDGQIEIAKELNIEVLPSSLNFIYPNHNH